jgi:hypothetical protein
MATAKSKPIKHDPLLLEMQQQLHETDNKVLEIQKQVHETDRKLTELITLITTEIKKPVRRSSSQREFREHQPMKDFLSRGSLEQPSLEERLEAIERQLDDLTRR